MICFSCTQDKTANQFSWKSKKDGIKNSKCKECSKTYSRQHYYSNIAKYKEKSKSFKQQTQERNRAFLIDYLSKHPCVDCNESDIVVLQFDHVRGKKHHSISAMTPWYSEEKLNNEIEKCEVRCANCHLRKTSKERGFYKSRL